MKTIAIIVAIANFLVGSVLLFGEVDQSAPWYNFNISMAVKLIGAVLIWAGYEASKRTGLLDKLSN